VFDANSMVEMMNAETLEDSGPAYLLRDMESLNGDPFHWDDEDDGAA
jgi:hypothetical protein